MKSKCLLFLTLCLFFNACTNEDELTTPDLKRVKREVRESISGQELWGYLLSLGNISYESSIVFDKREDAKEWKKLMEFRIGYAITDKIQRLNLPESSGWDVQLMKHAYGRIVNMDYFPITIEQMPTVNGKQLSPLEFFEHVRKNINDFIDPGTGVKFNPTDKVCDPKLKAQLEGETKLWESDNPFFALLSITIPVLAFGRNDGSVICSDYDNLKAVTESNWKFSTIKSSVDGNHPVSGNREFGYFKNDNGSYTFYTRGVDRMQFNDIFKEKTVDVLSDSPFGHTLQATMYYVNEKISNLAFMGSDALWSSFQSGVQDFVNSNKGKAQAQASKNTRYDWDKVKALFDRKKGLLSEAIISK